MEGCIVSPFMIYLLGVSNTLGVVSAITGIVCMILSFVSLLNDSEEFCKRSFKISLILLALSIFVPSRNTVIGMIVAKNVTYENVAKGTDVAKQSIDYIFDKIEKLNNTKE